MKKDIDEVRKKWIESYSKNQDGVIELLEDVLNEMPDRGFAFLVGVIGVKEVVQFMEDQDRDT